MCPGTFTIAISNIQFQKFTMKKNILLLTIFSVCLSIGKIAAQQDSVMTSLQSNNTKEFVSGAFKSSRVINGHSVEMIGKNVLDVRILHRFGLINTGFNNLYGLDQATMRMGFDYGLTKGLTIGIGRSTYKKEWDGLIKFRITQQSKGPGAFPFSIVWVSGMTTSTVEYPDTDAKHDLENRIGYYHEVIIGRKFNSWFSLQVSPVYVHQNYVDSVSHNDTWALGIGSRIKLSRRIAFVVDYHPILSGREPGTTDPLSIGIDIETGGHVFQLHFSNSQGMNERAFITETTDKWGKGEIRFGFNLSRVFSIGKQKTPN